MTGTRIAEGRAARFPLGDAVTLEQLDRDPYPIFARLRAAEPVSWVGELGMWYVTRHADARAVLLDTERFTTGWEGSTIIDTFGENMLTSEGPAHERYRRAMLEPFMPRNIRERLEPAIALAACGLIDGFAGAGDAELRAAFAARLPIQAMLLTFGLPLDAETSMRGWYDRFERALANFTHDPAVREAASDAVAEFHDYLSEAMRDAARRGGVDTLLGALVNAPAEMRLSDDEVRQNISIVFFGGISTVEALILNGLWALFHHPAALARARGEPEALAAVVDETMRWQSPVQSAVRHVVRDTELAGVRLAEGEVVSCMLGAANRDPAIFSDPDQFDIDRPNLGAQLGFAVGPHMCLGFRLAKAEARIALEALLTRLEGLGIAPESSAPPTGYEFRQPRKLTARWRR